MSLVKAAGFIIFRKSKTIEYLLLKASYGNFHWSPPKGHVDNDELDIVTAFRETEEEAGLKKNQLTVFEDFKKELRYEVKGKPKLVTYWLAEVDPETSIRLSDEHLEYTWLPLEDACKTAAYEDIQQVLRECHQFILNRTSCPNSQRDFQ